MTEVHINDLSSLIDSPQSDTIANTIRLSDMMDTLIARLDKAVAKHDEPSSMRDDLCETRSYARSCAKLAHHIAASI